MSAVRQVLGIAPQTFLAVPTATQLSVRAVMSAQPPPPANSILPSLPSAPSGSFSPPPPGTDHVPFTISPPL